MTLLQSNRSKENIAKLYQLRAQLNQIAEYKTEGAMIRSRILWHEKGEKNTKYVLNLEKRRFTKTHIARLKTVEERETTCENEILEMQRAFYENLHPKAPCNSDAYNAFLQDPNLVKLDEDELHELEQLYLKASVSIFSNSVPKTNAQAAMFSQSSSTCNSLNFKFIKLEKIQTDALNMKLR